MSAASRWADTEEDVEAEARRKQEKEQKKRARAEKQRLQDELAQKEQQLREQEEATLRQQEPEEDPRPSKRRRLSSSRNQNDSSIDPASTSHGHILRINGPPWYPCRLPDNFERLNHIEEGSYGTVSRAREIATGEIVALKKLKSENFKTEGFPITGIREIQCLMRARGHQNVVELKEIVMAGTNRVGGLEVDLVMEFLEHDLSTLQAEMQEPFLPSEVKTLMQQLAGAVEFLHSHWIMHRDLKTSNVGSTLRLILHYMKLILLWILMSNRGQIKLADFGMARLYSDPPPQLTQLVVTLWYRAPELLMGAKTYDEAIDLWSCGCIFAELFTRKPLFPGKTEVDQITKIFELCGVPDESSWPEFKRLPNARSLKLPPRQNRKWDIQTALRLKLPQLTGKGAELLAAMLAYDPSRRPRASEVLEHSYFQEHPPPKHPSMFPTFPSKAGQEKRRKVLSPSAPKRGDAPNMGEADLSGIFANREEEESGGGFQLKLG